MILLILLVIFGLSFSEEKNQEEEKNLSIRVELSFVRTTGNTNTQTFSEKGSLEYEGKRNRFFLENSFLFVKSQGKETANKLKVEGRWEHSLTDRLFNFLSTGYERDRFSGYDFKWNGGSGLGYEFIKSDSQSLKVLFSLNYFYNRSTDEQIDNYGTYKTELFYEWQILENLAFKQRSDYIRSLSDPDTYFINSESSVEVKVTEIISLGVSYKLAYQNKPPEEGVKRLDTTFSTSLILDF